MSRNDPLPIGEFLDALRDRLDALGARGTRRAIEAHARSLRPAQRARFLAIFTDPVQNGDTLLTDVDATVAVLDDLTGVPWSWRREWDDDNDDHLAAGAQVEDVLVAIGERFLGGDPATARVAYERLLAAVDNTGDREDGEVDLGLDPALLSEARARWIWCIAADADLSSGTAADLIAAAAESLAAMASLPRLEMILGAHPNRAAIDDAVWRSLATRLRESITDQAWPPKGTLELWLDLAEHLDGVDALLAAARDAGQPHRLEVYRRLVRRYAEMGRIGDAADVAVEALGASTDSYALADMADIAAELCEAQGRNEEARDAAARAWRANPTLRRLETVLDLSPAAPAETAAALERPQYLKAHLDAAVAIVSGDLGAAMARIPAAGPLDAPATTRLAIAACCAVAGDDPPLPLIEQALTAALRPSAHESLGRLGDRGAFTTEPARTPIVSRVLQALADQPRQPERLDQARTLLDARIAQVLGSDRSAYASVASLVVLVAHTAASAGGPAAAATIAGYDQRHRRYPAFRRELTSASAGA